MIYKIILIFILFSFNIFSNEIYPKELDLKDVPIVDVFAYLSKYSKYTIIGDYYLKDINIDCYFKKNTEIDEILKTISQTYGLTKIQNKNIVIYRGRKSENNDIVVGRVYDENTNLEVKNIKIILKNRDKLETISGTYGEYLFDNIVKGVYFLSISGQGYSYEGDFFEVKKGVNYHNIYIKRNNYKLLKKIGKKIHQNNKNSDIIENILLENSNYKEIQKILKDTFGKDLNISFSKMNNMIVIYGKAQKVLLAKELVAKLDKRKKQVRVTAEIIDVKENLFESLGFNWAYGTKGRINNKNNGIFMQSLISGTTDGIGDIIGSSINFISSFNNGKNVLNMTLNLLETTQDLTVNALPSIILLSGEMGTLKMTEEVIVGEDKEEDNDNDRVNYKPIFKEAGIILKVKPLIKTDGYIYLDLDLEASDFKLKKSLELKEENTGTFNSEGGSKISRNLKTKVRLKNNDVILIGGLKRKVDQKIKNKVPFLGDIPGIGILFKRTSSRIERTDLYIKLKAEIIEEN